MRLLLISILLLSNITFAQHHNETPKPDDSPIVDNLPSLYHEFVQVVGILKTEEIIALIGEPAKKITLRCSHQIISLLVLGIITI